MTKSQKRKLDMNDLIHDTSNHGIKARRIINTN
jgi:hypothetical protein